jgi:hypothetical protein
MGLSLIGAGFGRTGTLSLKSALETLGLGRCYHMVDVMESPGHAEIWDAAADGQATDWDALFEGYGAAIDWPPCSFRQQLMDHYPDAKVLLTIRDADKWYDSVQNTIYQAMTRPLETDNPVIVAQRAMARKLILEMSFGGRFEDRAYIIDLFQRHNEAVQREVPAERLLVYDVTQGWQPLCKFLDKPIPDAPFPHVNSTEEFRGRFKLDGV